MLLRGSLDDLAALSGAAAGALGIPDPAFVEKDYWVVELLRSLVSPLHIEPVDGSAASAKIAFKGGTSLSKAYGLIDRFSEDVDILVICQGLGRGATENRVLKPLCVRAMRDLGLTEAEVEWMSYETGRTRNVRYDYPRRLHSEGLRRGVVLEMGVRGGILPGTVQRTVRSYISEYVQDHGIDADFEELAEVEASVIAPARTLAEKLALLHHAGTEAVKGNRVPLGTAGRHFYDVYRLLSDDTVIEVLKSQTTMTEIAADVEANSEKFGWAFTHRPDNGYGTSVVFDPDGPVRRAAEEAFGEALHLVWRIRPSFDECLQIVAESARFL
jgi:predicted nucleotidyltransferase component of viral defense system